MDELRGMLSKTIKSEFDLLAEERVRAAEKKKKKKVAAVPQKVTTHLVTDTLHALASEAILSHTVVAPSWLSDLPGPPPAELLVCRNGIAHLPTCKVLQHTPRFFSMNALDYDFHQSAPRPDGWLEFLAQLWPDDEPGAVETLQEWFGYLLTPDTSQQKMLMLVGPKRAGKGVIARILRGLVGVENTAGPTLASLATNFGLWPLIGKSVAIISDARLGHRADNAVVTERLLSISGEDAQTIDRKHLAPMTTKLST
jgi:putative DNA primase/helicase